VAAPRRKSLCFGASVILAAVDLGLGAGAAIAESESYTARARRSRADDA
jgi:hypothetical protein